MARQKICVEVGKQVLVAVETSPNFWECSSPWGNFDRHGTKEFITKHLEHMRDRHLEGHQDGAREPAGEVWLYMLDCHGETYSLPCESLEDAFSQATGIAIYGRDGQKPFCIKDRSHGQADSGVLVSSRGLAHAIREPERRKRIMMKWGDDYNKSPMSAADFLKRIFTNIMGKTQ